MKCFLFSFVRFFICFFFNSCQKRLQHQSFLSNRTFWQVIPFKWCKIISNKQHFVCKWSHCLIFYQFVNSILSTAGNTQDCSKNLVNSLRILVTSFFCSLFNLLMLAVLTYLLNKSSHATPANTFFNISWYISISFK